MLNCLNWKRAAVRVLMPACWEMCIVQRYKQQNNNIIKYNQGRNQDFAKGGLKMEHFVTSFDDVPK